MVYFVFAKVVNPIWDNLYTFGQIFIVLNGKILQKQFGHLVTLNRNYIFTWENYYTLHTCVDHSITLPK